MLVLHHRVSLNLYVIPVLHLRGGLSLYVIPKLASKESEPSKATVGLTLEFPWDSGQGIGFKHPFLEWTLSCD